MTQTVLLGDEIGLVYGKGLPQRSRVAGDFPVFGSNGQVDTHNEPLVKGPGIIVGRKGSVGEVIWTDEDFWPIDTTYYVKLKNPNDNLKYWYYQLKTLGLNKLNSHSAIPGLNRDVAYAKVVTKRTPEEQNKIADILGTIDEKIELNRRMNETLEQMGQALFRHYFVDNPEAEKWEETTVDEFVNHLKTPVSPMKLPDTIFHQYSIPGYDNSFNPEVSRGDTIKSGKYKVEPKSILVSKLNPATPRIWAVLKPKENAICSTEFQVIAPKKYYAFCYFLLTSKGYTDKMTMSAGGTSNSHRRIKPSDILNYSFAKPNEETLQAFEQQAMTMLEMIEQNREQTQTLTTLRETLLPRLINGRVQV